MERNSWYDNQVRKVVFHELLEQSKSLSKIKALEYKVFRCQNYLSSMDTFSIRKIARLRSRTFACKANQKSANESNTFCRAGCSEVETQDHLLNCQSIHGDINDIDTAFVKTGDLYAHRRNLPELFRRMEVVENWSMD